MGYHSRLNLLFKNNLLYIHFQSRDWTHILLHTKHVCHLVTLHSICWFIIYCFVDDFRGWLILTWSIFLIWNSVCFSTFSPNSFPLDKCYFKITSSHKTHGISCVLSAASCNDNILCLESIIAKMGKLGVLLWAGYKCFQKRSTFHLQKLANTLSPC